MKDFFYQILCLLNWAAFAFLFFIFPAYLICDYVQYEYLRHTGIKTQATLLHKNIEKHASQKGKRRGNFTYHYYFHYNYTVLTSHGTSQTIRTKKEVDSELYAYEGKHLEIYYSPSQVNFSDIAQNTVHQEGLFAFFLFGGIDIVLMVLFLRARQEVKEENGE